MPASAGACFESTRYFGHPRAGFYAVMVTLWEWVRMQFRLPFYSSSHPQGHMVGGILGNPDLEIPGESFADKFRTMERDRRTPCYRCFAGVRGLGVSRLPLNPANKELSVRATVSNTADAHSGSGISRGHSTHPARRGPWRESRQSSAPSRPRFPAVQPKAEAPGRHWGSR